MSEWTTIESDPGVFTELIQKIGVQDVQVEELWSLDDEEFLDKLRPVYGLIFLFKWKSEPDNRPIEEVSDPDLFFARQTITNACATQALLSILLNSPEVNIGPLLENFYQFTKDLPPDMRGDSINSLEELRIAHNSFQRQDPFLISDDKKSGGRAEDAFHFIAYIPFKGSVYELDGLKPGPIKLGPYDEKDWIVAARPHIQQRIERYASSEIRFNLMAVIKDQRVVAKNKIAEINKRISQLQAALGSEDVTAEANFTPVKDAEGFSNLVSSNDKSKLKAQLDCERRWKTTQQSDLTALEEKFKSWEEENVRRKHNYVPFAVQLLKELSKAGKLNEMIEVAQKRKADRLSQAAGSRK